LAVSIPSLSMPRLQRATLIEGVEGEDRPIRTEEEEGEEEFLKAPEFSLVPLGMVDGVKKGGREDLFLVCSCDASGWAKLGP
jgi:hypothetical protein